MGGVYLAVNSKVASAGRELLVLERRHELLVRTNGELNAAYASGKAGKTPQLPEGMRGMYVIQKGQSLSEVAKAFYGDPGRWQDLVEANKEKILDPDMIEAGTVILIPD